MPSFFRFKPLCLHTIVSNSNQEEPIFNHFGFENTDFGFEYPKILFQCKSLPLGPKALRSIYLSTLRSLAAYGIPNPEMNATIEICYKGKDGMQIWEGEL
jgi:hypothetical protein